MKFACALLLCCGPAAAATCTVADSALVFGTYGPVSGSPTVANASILVSCGAILGGGAAATVTYTMLLSAGSSGTTANRKMTGGTPNLPYNIYTNGSYTTVWDNSTGVSGSVTLQGLLGLPVLVTGNDTQTAFGRILGSQAVAAGAYVDSLTITINY